MGKLIDADVVKEKIGEVWRKGACVFSCYDYIKAIDEIPAVEVKREIRACWDINCDGYYPFCTNCLNEPSSRKCTDYCENCGAKMINAKGMR